MGRDLKKYDEYLDKIKTYAAAIEIKIERKEEPSDGVYLPTRRVIRVDPDLDESEEISVLLHELGHMLDDVIFMTDNDEINDAYSKVYVQKLTKKQLEIVLGCEQRAWDNGRGLAKKLRIRLGKWYDIEEKSAMEDYSENDPNLDKKEEK